MTKTKELREKIEGYLYCRKWCGDRVSECQKHETCPAFLKRKYSELYSHPDEYRGSLNKDFNEIAVMETNEILKACQEAGLEFVDKDAEMPKAKMPSYPIYTKVRAFTCGVKYQCKLLEDAGWKKTEEI